MRVNVETLGLPAADPRGAEIVERKGIGHPDTICDALAEALSQALSRRYQDEVGAILHHNVDKALLFGGAADANFGGGEVTAPIEIYLAGRATKAAGGKTFPIEEIAEETCRAWLRRELHALDADRHVKLRCLIRPGSADLVELYERRRREGVLFANDTSIGVGYAPLSDLEQAVLGASARLREAAADPATPFVGEDTKVMGVRTADAIELTVACALVGRHLADLDAYLAARAKLAALAVEGAARRTRLAVTAVANAADDEARGQVYLTVTGTSAEAGDDGQVGRGNRVNGLITPYRPMTLEAAAGKNPVTHVGKLYNVTARNVAEAVVREIPEVTEAHCYLVSQIGAPVTEPRLADVRIRTRGGERPASFAPRIEAIVKDHLGRIATLSERILAGGVALY